MSGTTALLPIQPTEMSPAQLAAVSYLARYSGHTHRLYTSRLSSGRGRAAAVRSSATWGRRHSAIQRALVRGPSV